MGMANYEKSKFRFSETFNNKDGKTSGSGFIGVIFGLVAAFTFISGIFGWFFNLDNVIELFEYAMKLGATSAVLLGARKIAGQIWQTKTEKPETEDPLAKEEFPSEQRG